MLTTQGETSESDVLKRISVARGNAEPETAPTAEPEAVDLSEDVPVEEAETVTVEATDTEEEVVAVSETETSDDNGEDFYVDFKGREISFKDIEQWEQGNLRQADYTQKTQALANDRRAFEDERTEFNQQQSSMAEQVATLEAIISEDAISAEALAEMREYEPEAYIKHQEKIEARKAVLAKAKLIQPNDNVNVNDERQKLMTANPSWMDNGKTTPAFDDDIKLMQSYAADSGYSDIEMAGINQSHHMQTLLDAAKYRQMSKSNAAVEKRVRKAPVSTKPRAVNETSLQQKLKAAQAKLKTRNHSDDAVAVLRIKREIKRQSAG